MGSITPNPKKRGYLLPPGCKDLVDVLQDKAAMASLGTRLRESGKIRAPVFRVNGRIRAPEVQVVGERGEQLGIMAVSDALRMAQSSGVDLVEISPRAKPPVCRLVDFGKFRYKMAKKTK